VEQANSRQRSPRADVDLFAAALTGWVKAVCDACSGEAEWPERVGAGLYAAIGFLVEEPQLAGELLGIPDSSPFGEPYRRAVREISELLAETAPVKPKTGPSAPAAAIAGIGLVVGNHLRAGQAHRLRDLCPEMHLMVLLPFLGFDDAKHCVDEFKEPELT
jgi:hypothetical protein